MRLQWHSGHAVGVASIDSQAQELFRRVNRLGEAIRSGRVDAVATWLDLVRGAASVLFAEEEGLLRAARDPSLLRHHSEHLRLVEDLDATAEDLAWRGLGAVTESRLAVRLPVWMDVHAARSHRELAAAGRTAAGRSETLPARVAAQQVP